MIVRVIMKYFKNWMVQTYLLVIFLQIMSISLKKNNFKSSRYILKSQFISSLGTAVTYLLVSKDNLFQAASFKWKL